METQEQVNKLYWLYDMNGNEFFHNVSSKFIEERIGLESSKVSTYADHSVVYNEHIIWHNKEDDTPKRFAHHFVLPPKLKMDIMRMYSNIWGKKIAEAYHDKYRKPHQIIQLGDNGEIVDEFDSYQDAATKLDVPIGTIKSSINRATNYVHKKPIVCKRIQLEEVLEKYFTP